MAELVIGQCKACRGTGQQRCDVCGGTGEIDARDPFSRLRSRLASSGWWSTKSRRLAFFPRAALMPDVGTRSTYAKVS